MTTIPDNLRSQTASAVRYEQERLRVAHGMAVANPDYQPEMIARHYTSLATVALELLNLCEKRQHWPGDTADIDAMIDELTSLIRRVHLEDFAIPLEWKQR